MTGPVVITIDLDGKLVHDCADVWIVRRPFGDRDELDGPSGARRLANEGQPFEHRGRG